MNEWLTKTDAWSRDCFGRCGELVLERTLAVLKGNRVEFADESAIEAFLRECEQRLNWRQHEADPLPAGVDAALVRWDRIGPPSQRWSSAIRGLGWDSGIRRPIIAAARTVGTNIGGHHCGLLLAYVALELARPWTSQTFFCELMPWAWAGRWPVSVTDDTGQILLAYG